MILFPNEESKVAWFATDPAANENGTAAARTAFSCTAFREPILRLAASGGNNRPTKAFPAAAFREPILRMLAQRPSKR